MNNKHFIFLFLSTLIVVLSILSLFSNIFVDDVEYVVEEQNFLSTPYLVDPNNLNGESQELVIVEVDVNVSEKT